MSLLSNVLSTKPSGNVYLGGMPSFVTVFILQSSNVGSCSPTLIFFGALTMKGVVALSQSNTDENVVVFE